MFKPELEDLSFRGTRNSVLLPKPVVRSQPIPKKKSLCKPKVRLLKSKGVILVLVWNLIVFSYQNLALGTLVRLFPGIAKKSPWKTYVVIVFLQNCIPLLIYPIAGWVADAKIGRYKVIRGSLWVMWIGALLLLGERIISYSLRDVILSQVTDLSTTVADEFEKAIVPVIVLVYILNAIGIAGFQANLIPFGIDQMEDGSSDQCSAFVYWYYWTRNGSFGLIIQLLIQSFKSYCEVEEDPHRYELTDRVDLFILLLQVGFVTLAICLDLLFSNQVLNKDPKVHNPLKKVWKVSKFIAKNDHFVGQRKAITFSYSAPPQRSDFAKKVYGGPFDDDHVEDVETFWKIIVFIFSLGLGGVFLNDAIYYTFRMSVNHLQLPPPLGLSNCTTRHAIAELVYPMVFTLFIPIYEFLIYPLFRNYIPRMMVRIAVGMVLMLLSAIGMLILDSVGHALAEKSVCFLFRTHFYPETLLHLPVTMTYAIPLIILMGLGELVTFVSALELIIAQSPFGMRGLLVGFFYAINGLFTGLVGILLLTVSLSFQNSVFAVSGLSCGSWYYLVTIVIGLVGIVLYFIGARWYKKRQRGGRRMVNHQTIIESYYETSSEPDPNITLIR